MSSLCFTALPGPHSSSSFLLVIFVPLLLFPLFANYSHLYSIFVFLYSSSFQVPKTTTAQERSREPTVPTFSAQTSFTTPVPTSPRKATQEDQQCFPSMKSQSSNSCLVADIRVGLGESAPSRPISDIIHEQEHSSF